MLAIDFGGEHYHKLVLELASSALLRYAVTFLSLLLSNAQPCLGSPAPSCLAVTASSTMAQVEELTSLVSNEKENRSVWRTFRRWRNGLRGDRPSPSSQSSRSSTPPPSILVKQDTPIATTPAAIEESEAVPLFSPANPQGRAFYQATTQTTIHSPLDKRNRAFNSSTAAAPLRRSYFGSRKNMAPPDHFADSTDPAKASPQDPWGRVAGSEIPEEGRTCTSHGRMTSKSQLPSSKRPSVTRGSDSTVPAAAAARHQPHPSICIVAHVPSPPSLSGPDSEARTIEHTASGEIMMLTDAQEEETEAKAKDRVEADNAKDKVEADRAEDRVEADKAEDRAEADKAEDRAEADKAKGKVEADKAKDRVEADKAKDAGDHKASSAPQLPCLVQGDLATAEVLGLSKQQRAQQAIEPSANLDNQSPPSPTQLVDLLLTTTKGPFPSQPASTPIPASTPPLTPTSTSTSTSTSIPNTDTNTTVNIPSDNDYPTKKLKAWGWGR